ncbi:sensor histidine kinase [Oceanospirillum beijerinckii]|uniref:sensor histidine kinase n=1 Tax=Oceanospirillum beijerinckii TaxID=64976 RepID=UPI00040290BF|nr:ATP-binding protein [Oceanospirillum beijerinckii]
MSASAQDLQVAFQEFTALSEQLTASYNELQDKIVRLTEDLEEAKRQRLQELEQKQLIAEKLENLLNLLPVGVVVMNGAGVVGSANPTAKTLLGNDIEGCRWIEVIEQSFSPKQNDGYEISLKDGRLVSIATRSLDKEPGQMVVINDMTETRRLQEQLSRTERLTEMGQMVASLAHQIRTPLSAAMLYAGHLQASDLSEANRVKFAGKLQGRLQNLEQQIGDMLQFARGGSAVAEQFHVADFFEYLKASLEGIFLQSSVACEWQLNGLAGLLLGHQESLCGALQNLVNNAIQAGSDKIELRSEIVGASLEISVIDNGPGIPDEQLEKILEPFFTTKSRGTGLGLAIVQSVVSAHKGSLTVHSEIRKGSCFTVHLPLVTV